ncbi:hypothetical protein ACWKWN_13730 [Microbacterium trichothecenolyticum]
MLNAKEVGEDTVALNPRHALAAVQEIASRSGRCGAALTVEEIPDTLRDRYGMIEAVEVMAEAASAWPPDRMPKVPTKSPDSGITPATLLPRTESGRPDPGVRPRRQNPRNHAD